MKSVDKYEVQFMFKDLPTINSMFFDDINDAMKFAKEKESYDLE